MIRFACPSCQKPLSAPEEKAGVSICCPGCKQRLTIPGITAVPTSPVPPAAMTLAPPVPTAPAAAPPSAPLPVEVSEPLVLVESQPRTWDQWATSLEQDLGVTALGFCTSLATAILLWLVDITTGFSLYMFSACLVIPVGAMFSGGLAASGYYWGAKLFGRRPTCRLLLYMVCISLFTFFFMHFLTYASMKLLGVGGPEHASFFSHIATVYRESEVRIRHTNIGKMGAWAYVEIPLEIIGFALGGLAVYGWLLAQPYCEACSRYMSKKGKQTRYTEDEDAFTALRGQIGELAETGKCQEAIDAHATFGTPKATKNAVIQSRFEVRYCHGCGLHWAGFSVQRKHGFEWQADTSLDFTSLHQGELYLPEDSR